MYACLDPHIHTVLICGLIKVRKFYRAIHVFREAVADANSLDVVSYTFTIIHGMFCSGRTTEAYIVSADEEGWFSS